MKRFIFFACVYAAVGCACPFAAAGQDTDPYSNYVVIGAFAHHKNAVRFTQDANQHKFPARFEMNHNRNLYYVFVLTTDDRDYAIAEALKLRTDTKYFDTWVFSGPFGEAGLTTPDAVAQDFDPATGQKITRVSTEQVTRDASREHTTTATRAADDRKVTPVSGNRDQRNTAERLSVAQNGIGQDTEGQKRIAGERGGVEQEGTTSLRGEQNVETSAVSAQNATVGTGEVSKLSDLSGGDRANLSGQKKNNLTGQQVSGQRTQADGVNNASQKNQEKSLSLSDQTAMEEPGNRSGVNGPPLSSTDDVADRVVPPRELPTKVNTAPLTAEEVVGKNFFFQLLRADNHKWVEGEVDAIDFEKARRMATYQANTPVKVILPSGKSKRISFVCQVFGYRKQQIEFDPSEPSPDFFLDEKANLIVPFELVRLQKGDIAIMYNVFFFKDAAVMRPESRYEVNNLLDLLKENPSYNIRIHGHTNGNASGKIIRMDKGQNFYSLSDTKQGFGSAKTLSEERASVIKEFLVSSGISEERMQIKAWGGKKPIHDKNSVRAIENVRVEIEILSD